MLKMKIFHSHIYRQYLLCVQIQNKSQLRFSLSISHKLYLIRPIFTLLLSQHSSYMYMLQKNIKDTKLFRVNIYFIYNII